jgi:gamma-glutamylcyclotransferase (GGCT)/AIG2-like uncharacterized protein YtfP
MTAGSELLFVYGTLLGQSGHPMSRLLAEHGRLLGEGSIRARLYIIDDPDEPGQNFYPGAVPSANAADRVFGELHQVLNPTPVFEAFDVFEACAPGANEPYEFLRRPVLVTLKDGTRHWARSYLYTWDVSGARHVPSGRYTEAAPDIR